MRGTIWYLAVWALTLALNQSISIMTGRAPVIVSCLALAGAGGYARLWDAATRAPICALAQRTF